MNTPTAPAGSTVEDYVKAIYVHTEWQPEPITTSGLAARLGLAASSVTEMVKKLGVAGLVTHVPYGAVSLTPDGAALAVRMVRRHRLIETWLVQSFRYGWDEVHDEAEVLEHALSERLLDAIDSQLGHPVRDPHGDPIPASDGSVLRPDAVRLSDAPDGSSGVIVRISDRDPALLRHLASEGPTVDSEVTIVGRRPFGGALQVRLLGPHGGDSVDRDLGEAAAASIWIALTR